ncbi:uncharacterized protein LOC143863460 [Tasmannia lanceolata]|uniref:uncharacterized protein LOC143863460 n=1 Tax=Tasmannia lanceolata TaxID=3420 RepID=UPI004062B459
MDLQAQDTFNSRSSQILRCTEEELGFSFERCCFFLCLYLLLGVAAVGALAFSVVFILRPRKPIFSLQALRLDSFNLDSSSGSHVYVSSVVSLVLNAQNPNKVGLSYSSSHLEVIYKGLKVGDVEVPKFYQPAHSKNVSLQTQVVLERVNLSQIDVSLQTQGSSSDKSTIGIRIVGDIKARIHMLHLTLPKIKVALDCEINVDYRGFIFNEGNNFMREYVALHSSSQPSSKECTLAVYI